MLKNELLQLEEIIYQIYTDLKKYKYTKNINLKDNEEIEIEEFSTYSRKKRGDHFEQLYNTIVASSLFPHLRNQSPVLKELGIKDNLINFEALKEKNIGLGNLSTHSLTYQVILFSKENPKKLIKKFKIQSPGLKGCLF